MAMASCRDHDGGNNETGRAATSSAISLPYLKVWHITLPQYFRLRHVKHGAVSDDDVEYHPETAFDGEAIHINAMISQPGR